ncbi:MULTISPECIES: hypothetical protein [unclassified Nitratireductor]|uniref:hypothetical protein n=1 Tax=unclassified Nitratireductor TaxID=2641084 RepID=UPI0025CDEE73|nr:hypothetical protein [Nitratireductor sp.]
MKQQPDTRPHTSLATLSRALPNDIVAALDRFSAMEGAGMTREQALLTALRTWALSKGLLKTQEGGREGLRPEQLNATNDD